MRLRAAPVFSSRANQVAQRIASCQSRVENDEQRKNEKTGVDQHPPNEGKVSQQ